ncbi:MULTISPECIES: autotransporter outer membrane beta-barrel domain-containing protein [Rhodopseudomonas]|uniref:Autotransporter domain-containing protein n=1 Tax=Rhodopseudomonas palustris TaxID=1076 RepID=A0A0D7EDP2_RHOPL|nr:MULTISPECIES: autotransporter outer membrane beta-barrel domain-containing protein [Rhodopseudomonas]KIZ38954.1 hypothetical protein OO17_21945 [Rhodopseudomonas palustris]MDF3811818.1 autotransporter domain-containing protein [Rhodopseudomonas sp. BAL398]WOK20287.1 autotransporter domain-containing protein [Rhodopseudomonas sp. BAL398]
MTSGVRAALLAGTCLCTALIAATPAAAVDGTWFGTLNSLWNIGTNWSSTPTVPDGTATFTNNSAPTDVTVTSTATLAEILFTGTAPAYVIRTGSAGPNMTLTGLGIVNDSANVQTFNVGGGLIFENSSSAGSNVSIVGGNWLQFKNSSTAGRAAIVNNNTADFTDTSSAGNAVITNNAFLVFDTNSTAGNATITTNSTTQGTTFYDNSTGGNAQFITNAGGFVDFSTSTGPAGDNRLTAGSIAGAGNYYLGANQLSVGGNNLSTIVSGIISDCGTGGAACGATPVSGGGLAKTGTGTMTLSGSNTYTGATSVNAGTLNVAGSISSSVLTTVNSGATLTGIGTAGNTVVAGGTFAPGSGTAGSSMTVAGTLGFNAAATYLVNVDPTASSFAKVTGTATLGGATVNASYAPGSYIAKQYTILTAGGISGSFGALSASNLPANFSNALSYEATHAYLDLTLSFVPTPTPTPEAPKPTPAYAAGLNGNQISVGNALVNYFNSTGGIPTVFGTLSANGLSQASGQPGASTAQSGSAAVGQFVNTLFADAFGTGSTGDGGALGFADAETGRSVSSAVRDAYAAVTPRARMAPAFEGGWGGFASVYGGNNQVSGDAAAGTSTTTSRAYGAVVGAGYHFTRDTQAGFALGGASSDFAIDGGFGGGHAEILNAALFAKHEIGAAYLAGAVTYSWQNTRTERTVTIAGIDVLRAKFNANALAARLEGGWRHATPLVGITPYAALQSTTFFLPSYGETASAGSSQFALSYESKRATTTRTELGARFDKTMLVQGGLLTLTNRTAWAHDANIDRSATATFQSLPGATFTSNGALPSPNAVLASLGATMAWHNGWSVAALADGEFSRTTQVYTGKATARFAW